MNQLNDGLDSNQTYYQFNFIPNSTLTVFIHGVGLDHSMWYPQKKKFKKKSVLFYDLLNHGKSKGGINQLSFNLFADQLNQLIDYLNLKKINLIGFSIGALIAQHFTSNYYNKINKLILIGSVYNRKKSQISIVKNRYKDALNGQSITKDSIERWFTEEYLRKNKNVYNFFYNLLEKKNNKDFLAAYKLFVESDNYSINFKKISVPTLIMTGEKEIGSTPQMSEDIHKKISNSSLYIIKDAKHGATIEKSENVNSQISKFLY